MTRKLLPLAVLAAATAPAVAQSPADYLPRDPGTILEPARPVAPPEAPEEVGPVAPDVGGGPSFVLRGVEVEGAAAVPAAELEPIWAELVGQPVTVATLEELAARVGAAYRARGFVLSQAVLPEQTVEGGVVRVLVVEGFVDRVALTGGTAGQQAEAARLFAPVERDRPLRLTTLERSVLLARDTFAGTVETVLEPSPDTFAAADLGVLLEPERFTGFAAADNRGSRLYGDLTLSAGASAYNLLGLNERIDGLVAVAPESSSLGFLQAGIDVPLPALDGTFLDGGRLLLDGDIARSDPDLGRAGSPDGLTVTQDESNLRAGLFVPFVRTRSMNVFGRFGLDWQDSTNETVFAGTTSTSTDRLLVLNARLTVDVADRLGGVTLFEAELRQGLDAAGAEVGDTGPAGGHTDFTAAALTLTRLQRLGESPWSLWLEAIGQLASTVLPNSERFALGGSTIGRGFAPANTTGDTGWGTRVEIRRQLDGGAFGGAVGAVELYAFNDYGRAYDRADERDGERSEPLGSLGIGARIDVRPWLTLTPEIARQTDGAATDTTDSGHETRFLIGAVARF